MNSPNTMEDAVFAFIQMLSPKQMDEIAKRGMAELHFTTGMQIRNDWNFWEDCPLRRDAIKRWGLAHADDLSGMLFEWVTAECRGQTFDKEAYIKQVQDHWAMFGETSCSAVNLNEDGSPFKKN